MKIAQEVYMRITNNRKGYEKHLNRLQEHSPKTGQVMILKLTEKREKTYPQKRHQPSSFNNNLGGNLSLST